MSQLALDPIVELTARETPSKHQDAIIQAVRRYNELVQQGATELVKIKALEQVAKHITLYAAWRPPYAKSVKEGRTAREERWEKLDTLKQQVVKEAKDLKVKLLNAPQQMIATQGSADNALLHFNWLECVMPLDGPNKERGLGQELSDAFAAWIAKSRQSDTYREPFWDYLSSTTSDRTRGLGNVIYKQAGDADVYMADGRKGAWKIGRKNINVDQLSLIVVPAGTPNGIFYYLLGEPRKIHHSSLAAGGAVRFAGEFTMSNGQFTKLTLRTGHYIIDDDTAKSWVMAQKELNSALIDIPVLKHDGIQEAFNMTGPLPPMAGYVAQGSQP